MELGPEDVSLLERCPHFRGCYVQELGPEDVSLLEMCPHFRGCYVQASMELGPEDVSLLERCPHFRRTDFKMHAQLDHTTHTVSELLPNVRECWVQLTLVTVLPFEELSNASYVTIKVAAKISQNNTSTL